LVRILGKAENLQSFVLTSAQKFELPQNYHHISTEDQRRLLQFKSSWWWERGCPKHVELYLDDEP